MKPNKLSKTAAYIAIKFHGLTLSDTYRSLFDEKIIQYYNDLVYHFPSPLGRFHFLLKQQWFRETFLKFNEMMLPGDLMHILMRKHCVNKMVEGIIREGYTQLLVLGAGFDHLATFQSERGIRSVELDAPRMANLKTSFIQNQGYNNKDLTIVPIYFSRDNLAFVLDVLTKLDPSQPTIVVAEGFFDYFTPDQCRQVLIDLSQFFKDRVALVSTVFSLEELSPFRAFIYKTSTSLAGERLRLHHSLAEFTSLLMEYNFITDCHTSASDMHQKHLHPLGISLPVLSGFHLLRVHNRP